MPIRVIDLESGNESNTIRNKILLLLKKDPALAYKLKEIYNNLLEEDKKTNNKYKNKPNSLYKLIYNYLLEFKSNKIIIHKGGYYFYNKKGK